MKSQLASVVLAIVPLALPHAVLSRAPFAAPESVELTIDATDAGMDAEAWTMPEDGFTHTLAATLTLPDPAVHGDGPHPGVVLVTGSGPQDRNETLMGHEPFRVLAEVLSADGIAVLRFDDRGVAESTGSFEDASVEAHARDAWFAARTLMDHERVDPQRVGIVGHSQGGTTAPYLAAHDGDIAFIVMLAGTGVSGGEVLIDQTRIMYQRTSNTEAYIETALAHRAELFDAMCAGAGEETLLDHVTEIAMTEFRQPDEKKARELARNLLPNFTSVPMASLICHDPRVWLARIDVPVLAVVGSLDTQVTPAVNLGGIRGALADSDHAHATLVELTGLNHLFQRAETGALGEYARDEPVMVPRLTELVSAWIRGQESRRGAD